jgi:polar amino acid transport system permease protein
MVMLAEQPLWDWAVVREVMPLLLDGLKITLLAVAWGMAIAATFGLLLAIMRRSKVKLISWPIAWLIEFVRSTPLLIQLFLMYFAITPTIDRFCDARFGFQPFGESAALWTGIVVLGVHYSTYASEAYRAGIQAVARGQWEACRALNLTSIHTWTRIILPQAIPPVIPALGNNLVAMFKDTPLLYAITVVELFTAATSYTNETFRYIEPYTLVGLIFLALSLVAAVLIRLAERRLVLREH